MKKLMILLLLALGIALFGCGGEEDQATLKAPEEKPVEVARTLTLEWQRMIDEEGNVCCGSPGTEEAVSAARERLAKELEDSGIDVVLVRSEFTPEECMGCPERANRVLVAGRGVDFWLGADMSASPCEGFCKQALGDEGSCQNLVYEGETYEVIPAELIVKAGLTAAANPATFKQAAGGRGSPCGGCPSKSTCGSVKMKTASSCGGSCDCACCEAGQCDCGGKCACACCRSGECSCGHTCTCEGECDGSCHKKGGCTCDGPCDGSCKVDAKTTKAAGCPNARTCGSKGCAVGG
jgi:hypothetical protein